MKLIDAYFLFAATLCLVSCYLYFFLPHGTIKFFLGTPSTTAAAWVQIVTAGDVLVAFIFIYAYFAKAAIKRFAIYCIGVYGFVHFGSFLRAHYFFEPHPAHMVAGYWQSMVMTTAVLFWWGYYRPPRDD